VQEYEDKIVNEDVPMIDVDDIGLSHKECVQRCINRIKRDKVNQPMSSYEE
jgi:hypothetical protein